MTPIHIGRLGVLSTAAALMVACSGPSADPLAPTPPSLAVFSAGEAELVICKASATAGAFDFAWAISLVDGTPFANGTVHGLASGDCALAASVPTTNGGRFRATVTEAPLAADWSLTGIGATFSHAPIAVVPVVNLGARTISNVFMANDVGATVTFTNQYTPPPPPPQYCTLTQGYWKNHGEEWDQAGEKYVTTSQLFYNSGASYLTILKTPPAGGNAYFQLAHQFIAASLNVNGVTGSGVAAVDAALAGAHAAFTGWAAGTTGPAKKTATIAQWQAWASTLDAFNNGVTGPGHCN